MNINVNSWHYRFIRSSFNGNVAPATNLCPYVRQLVWASLKAFLVTFVVLLISGLAGMWASDLINTFFALGLSPTALIALAIIPGALTVATIVGACGLIGFGIYKVTEYYENRKSDKMYEILKAKQEGTWVEPEVGLIRSYLTAKHDKICPKLEFKRD